MKSARILAVLAVAVLSACGRSTQAVGTVSSVIVVAPDSVWAAVGDSVLSALAPRIFTVRDEPTFDVTHVSPDLPQWTELRAFRQVLVIGSATDFWVKPVLDKANAHAGTEGVVQAEDVWARNQFATALVVPSANQADAVVRHLPRLAAVIDSTFRNYAILRMYTSQPDTVLRDSLRAAAGFSILLPNVYTRAERGPDYRVFNNSTQIGGSLIRSVLITERPVAGEVAEADVLAWRDSVAADAYETPQLTQRDRIETRAVQVAGGAGTEVQGIWRGTDPTWPTSGPFITRVIRCGQDRTFLVDAWLYAPSRSKYEYMIQLQTILDTFECVT